MTDKLKESISALIDGEASEIEVHRLLRQLDSDKGLKSAWMSYLQARSVIQGESSIPVARHLELYHRISSAIDAEETFDLKTERRTPRVRAFAKPITGLAVAASLAAAVMVGYYLQTPGSGAATGSPLGVGSQAIAAQPVSTAATQATQLQARPMDMRQLDQQQRRELRAYLNMHDQMARMQPNAQMVMYENPSSNQ